MKRLFRLLLALMVSASMIFAAVSCSDGGSSSSGSKKDDDDDEDEDVYEEAVWAEFDDVEFIKLLESYEGCDKVKYEEGWDDSDDLDAEDDVSKDATACTYRIKTEDGDIYLFMELEDDELTAKGMIDIDGDECDEDETVEFLEELADNIDLDSISDGKVQKNVEENVEENVRENVAIRGEDATVQVTPNRAPVIAETEEDDYDYDYDYYGPNAYGSFYFGMSMSDALDVISGETDVDYNYENITVYDWDDEYYDEDYYITGDVNCDYISLDFSDDSLYYVYISTDDISEYEAEDVLDSLTSYYGYDYEYDPDDSDSSVRYYWGDSGVSAYLYEWSNGYYEWSISISNYDYY